MLIVTRAATAAIQVLSLPTIPERSGLRLRPDADHAPPSGVVAVVGRPAPDDDVIVVADDDAGAAVFVDRAAVALVDDQILDARMDEPPTFCLKPQPGAARSCIRPVPLLAPGSRTALR